ncbi:MAG: glycosyltransferase family 4 protein [Chitinophagaceae bacterium]
MDVETYRKRIAVLENGLLSTYTMREALMLRLRDEGHKVYVITHTNQYQKVVQEWGIDVIHVGFSNQNPIGVLRYIYRVYKSLKTIRPEICLTFSIRPAIWGNMVCRLLKIPTITNITGIGPLFDSKSFVYKIARFLYKLVLKTANKVFFQNVDDMNLFIRHKFVKPENAEMLPGSGVDPNKFIPLEAQKKTGTFVFLFIGRLIKDKGIYEYINAAKEIKEEFPNVIFQIIGPFWHQNLKTNLIKPEELQNWIDGAIIDYLGEKLDVRQYIADVDCVVLPSYREGMSNVLLESSSMERPCITTNVTGCKEIIEDGKTGFLCKVQDSHDLADKMRKMLALSREERIQMGRNGRKKIIKEFSKETVINAYLEAVQQYSK